MLPYRSAEASLTRPHVVYPPEKHGERVKRVRACTCNYHSFAGTSCPPLHEVAVARRIDDGVVRLLRAEPALRACPNVVMNTRSVTYTPRTRAQRTMVCSVLHNRDKYCLRFFRASTACGCVLLGFSCSTPFSDPFCFPGFCGRFTIFCRCWRMDRRYKFRHK